jgi:hypothetical protein
MIEGREDVEREKEVSVVVTFRTSIRKMLDSYLGQDTGCPEVFSRDFFLW